VRNELHARRFRIARHLHADLDLLLAAPRRDLERRVVEGDVEDDDAWIDLQGLAVRVEGRVQRFDAPIRAQLAVLRRLDLKLALDLALEPEAAPLQVVAEVELQVERHRDLRRLARAGGLLADDHDVLAELRHASLVELEVAAVRAQRSAERQAFLDNLRLAAAGRHQPHIGPLQQREFFGAPGQARAALGEAQRQGAARGELAFAALDGELLHAQDVLFEHSAQLAALQVHAQGRRLEPDRLPAQRARHNRLAERAAALQV